MNSAQQAFLYLLSVVAVFGFAIGIESDLQRGIVACCGIIPAVLWILGKV